VIRHDDLSKWIAAAKDDVAAILPLKDEPLLGNSGHTLAA
jgi:hypothetical protein